MDFLRRIPQSWPIMRMVTDTPKEMLLAPRWWFTKGQFITYVDRQMHEREWRQADLVAD